LARLSSHRKRQAGKVRRTTRQGTRLPDFWAVMWTEQQQPFHLSSSLNKTATHWTRTLLYRFESDSPCPAAVLIRRPSSSQVSTAVGNVRLGSGRAPVFTIPKSTAAHRAPLRALTLPIFFIQSRSQVDGPDSFYNPGLRGVFLGLSFVRAGTRPWSLVIVVSNRLLLSTALSLSTYHHLSALILSSRLSCGQAPSLASLLPRSSPSRIEPAPIRRENCVGGLLTALQRAGVVPSPPC
jgi:hypothetical protein